VATHRSPTCRLLDPRRRLVIAAAVLAPLLAGCGAGFQAETNQIYQPGPGISIRAGGVFALNTLIVTDGNSNGTLVASLINQAARPDALIHVNLRASNGKPLKATIVTDTVPLPSRRAVQLGSTGDVRVTGDLSPGTDCWIRLTFRNALPIVTRIPIVADSPEYDDVPIGSVPTTSTPN